MRIRTAVCTCISLWDAMEAAHLLAHEAVGVHEDGEVYAEDWDAAEGVAMKAGLLEACLEPRSDGATVQPRGDQVCVLRNEKDLCEHQHRLRTHRSPSHCWLDNADVRHLLHLLLGFQPTML